MTANERPHLARALLDMERQLVEERQRRERAEARLEEFRREWWRMRDVEEPCKKCHGAGSLVYGNTSTWRGGGGGSALTRGVCDACWGSGEEGRPWLSHREADAALRRAGEGE